eukprot:TRINITY_DN50875_c0_g1_i1.p2 TRINITY_DN50875_c0_g1~~TRINITY_DN50875_c0_g1_i1.p2  ORF type:complete len:144 (+),score=54.73 TRINITY_DN50875_c0_g1_i1:69-500(+)
METFAVAAAFRHLDRDEDGKLGKEDLEIALQKAGHEAKEETIKLLAAGKLNSNGAAELDVKNLQQITDEYGSSFGTKDIAAHALKAFDTAGEGEMIDASQLIAGLSLLGTEATEAEAKMLIKQFDQDGDGLLSRPELMAMLGC